MQKAEIDLEEVRFNHPRLGTVGVEMFPVVELLRRVSASHLATPQRVDFYMLMLVHGGYLRHCVDFEDMRMGAGSLVFVRPGQVQQWHLDARADGSLLLIDPSALVPMPGATGLHNSLQTSLNNWPAGVRLSDSFVGELGPALDQLNRDLSGFDGSREDTLLVRQQLLTVLLRIDRWHRRQLPPDTGRGDALMEVFRLFRAALEDNLRSHWTVADAARRLGYSESTINRACKAAAGHSAKVLMDRRLAMEAARILGYSTDSVAQVAHGLGFSEPTNFIRFFQRMVGTTPQRFRQQFKPAGH